MAIFFPLVVTATPPYTLLYIWVFKVIVVGTVFALGTSMIWVYRRVRRLLLKQIPPIENWRRPRWMPRKLWNQLFQDASAIKNLVNEWPITSWNSSFGCSFLRSSLLLWHSLLVMAVIG